MHILAPKSFKSFIIILDNRIIVSQEEILFFRVNDEEIGMGEVDNRIVEPVLPENRDEQKEKDERLRQFFAKLAGDDNEVDWHELQEILNYAMREGMTFKPKERVEELF